MPTCAFCGYRGKLTGEHVLGDWLSRIGLDMGPVPHGAGPLNRIGRGLGVRPPYRQRVRDVCGDCNHGWMSRLEVVARRVLTPFILGEHGTIPPNDQSAVAAWIQKTALTAMLVSSEEDREGGYGLPASEYRALYAIRDMVQPLSGSQFWVGRYSGVRGWSVRVTPLAIRVRELHEPDRPQGYVMTIVLGQLVLHGLRFTTVNDHVIPPDFVRRSPDSPQGRRPSQPRATRGRRPDSSISRDGRVDSPIRPSPAATASTRIAADIREMSFESWSDRCWTRRSRARWPEAAAAAPPCTGIPGRRHRPCMESTSVDRDRRPVNSSYVVRRGRS